MLMHLGTYGFTVLAVNLLGPAEYGALAGMMAALLIMSVVQLGIQANAARRVATHPESAGRIESLVLRLTWWAALALGAALVVLSPVIARILQVDTLPTALMVAAVTVPLTVSGGQSGILQGERRWTALAAVYAAHGLPRMVVGVLAMAWRPSALTAMVAIAVCQWLPVLLGAWLLRRARRHRSVGGAVPEGHGARSFVQETVHNAHTLLAFFALTNLDIIVARNVLDGHDAGLYAAGLIVSKAVLFLPQFVVVVAYPALSGRGARRTLGLGLALIAGLGSLVVLVSWLVSGLVLTVISVGSTEYAAIEGYLWTYAVIGTVLAMLQLLVYTVLAQRAQRWSGLLWVAVVALVAATVTTDSVRGLLTAVAVVDSVLLAALLAVAWRFVGRDVPVSAPPRASSDPCPR